MMTLIKTNIEILKQLKIVLTQYSNEEYSQPLTLLSNNSIGKHVRHVIEFYECLFKGIHLAEVNYDKRERNLLLESDLIYTINMVDLIIEQLERKTNDLSILLVQEFGENEAVNIQSSYFRELAYNIEHAIHHFAIISIANKSLYPHIQLPENFGTAYSTIQYQTKQCVQ